MNFNFTTTKAEAFEYGDNIVKIVDVGLEEYINGQRLYFTLMTKKGAKQNYLMYPKRDTGAFSQSMLNYICSICKIPVGTQINSLNQFIQLTKGKIVIAVYGKEQYNGKIYEKILKLKEYKGEVTNQIQLKPIIEVDSYDDIPF